MLKLPMFKGVSWYRLPLEARCMGELLLGSTSKVSALTRFGECVTEDTSEYSEGVRLWLWNWGWFQSFI